MSVTTSTTKFVNLINFFLLLFIASSADTPENLVTLGHLSVLGMLLLKQQSKKIKKNDFSICRYIQITIRFLWDAYTVDESNDPEALVVSITYKEFWNEIAELWFLGMQTMSGIIQQIPWISVRVALLLLIFRLPPPYWCIFCISSSSRRGSKLFGRIIYEAFLFLSIYRNSQLSRAGVRVLLTRLRKSALAPFSQMSSRHTKISSRNWLTLILMLPTC